MATGNGIKVEGGDRLGKTIIFAKNSKHARFIVDRFNEVYPHYKGQFAQLIDYSVSYDTNGSVGRNRCA
ncbi:hypothetical protein DSD19_15770 [Rhodovulum sp. BSW8]|uniref:Uncharacterized protein n=1 Tax=Rhodovulum visakhapatnamense TaxID=364297 RepID=A0A4R8FV92_9RHOB|nr:hypothetical protein [Rhodovulum]RBO52246.1 hypothetical protein DSD19_15770 [Rhodovulum sp. BSW8]TDX27935.1 hypothetical protein EV657_11310 [Rhodovulum visakhapatnamense]